MKKTRLLAVLAATLFCVLAVGLYAVWQNNAPSAEAGEKHITAEVVHKDGTTAEFSYDTDAEYLGPFLEAQGLISGSDSEYGLFVDTVDGETADYSVDGGWWHLACNGEDAQTGADFMVLTDGDTYIWTYTTG